MRPVSVAALVVAFLALWITRRSWLIPWERAGVLNVVLQMPKVIVAAPAVDVKISSKLHTFTGVWNLEELTAHLCYIVGIYSVLYMVASRLDMTRSEWRSFFRYRIELPAVLCIALTSALFMQGPGKSYVPDTISSEPTDWLRWYFFVMHTFEVFALIQIVQGLLILRRDPRSRKAANAYLCAVTVTFIAILAFQLELRCMQWLFVRFEVIAYAIAASYAWHSKRGAEVPSDYLMPG